MSKINKAIFPVAGLGTRMLPLTKLQPKEMLPLANKPLIHYAAKEAIDAGCDELIFITNHHNHEVLQSYFNRNINYYKGVKLTYLKQKKIIGLGNAIQTAEHIIHKEPFFVILPDDVITGNSALDMKNKFNSGAKAVVAVKNIVQEQFVNYGVAYTVKSNDTLIVKKMVEKPSKSLQPLPIPLYGVVGRYILSPEIFSFIDTNLNNAKEINITDALSNLAQIEIGAVRALAMRGHRYDCGSKLGYSRALNDFNELVNV